jgi:hypothetical protein
VAKTSSKKKPAAKRTSRANGRANGGANGKSAAKRPAPGDAEALLRADHRKVESLFKKYENSDSESEKESLAEQICGELIIHTKLEEEIFYPACRDAEVEHDDMDEAQVEHDGAKLMIKELMEGSPSDEYYDAKVKVLSEYIKHHVKEEEEPKGIFAQARKAGVDMKAVGAQIKSRKEELMAEKERVTSTAPQPVSMHA